MKTSSVRAFMRKEDYAPRQTPAGSLCREFIVHCFRCGSYDVRMQSQFDEEAGEISVWLVCRRCPGRERVKVN